MGSKNKTTTDYRLKQALSKAMEKANGIASNDLKNAIDSSVEIRLGKITKWWQATNEITANLIGKDKTVKCEISHLFLSNTSNISFTPQGVEKLDDELQEYYIEPLDDLIGILAQTKASYGGYVLLGLVNNDSVDFKDNANPGEFLIQVGDNKISVNEKRINIKSENLFINGLEYVEAKKAVGDTYSKKEVDEKLEGISDEFEVEIHNHTHYSRDILDLVDIIYPVGSIYMSTSSVDPSVLFGGVWERIKDTFLLASGNTYSEGSVGGSADSIVVEHNHEQNAHNHGQNAHNHAQNGHTHTPGSGRSFMTAPTGSGWNEIAGSNISGSGYHYVATQDKSNFNVYVAGSGSTTATNKETTATNKETTATNKPTGESGVGKNMPPYLAVNVWKRLE